MSESPRVTRSGSAKRRPAIVGPSAYKRWRAALKRLRAFPENHEGRVLYLEEFASIMDDWRRERRAFKAVLRGR